MKNQFKQKQRLGAAVLVLAGLASTPAFAASSVGTYGNDGADGVVTLPPSGDSVYQYISTSGGVGGAGQLPGIGGTDGSSYTSSVFSANAGDNLQFYFDYVTSDGAGYSDYGWAQLQTAGGTPVATLFTARTTPSGDTSPGFGLPANDSILSPSSTPIVSGGPVWGPLAGSSGSCYSAGCGYTGWIKSSYTIVNGGSYQVVFGVSNWTDTIYDSGLAFDQVSVGGVEIDPVPEPETYAMMALGLVLAGMAARRGKGC